MGGGLGKLALSHSNRACKHYNSCAISCFLFAMALAKFPLWEQFSLGTSLLNLSCLNSISLGGLFTEKNLSSQQNK